MANTSLKWQDLMRLSNVDLIKECKKYKVCYKGSKFEIVDRILSSQCNQDNNSENKQQTNEPSKNKAEKKLKKKKQLKKKKTEKKSRNVPPIHTILLSYCRNIEKQLKLTETPKDVIFIIGYYYAGKQIIFGIGEHVHCNCDGNVKSKKITRDGKIWMRLEALEALINDWNNLYVMSGAIVAKSTQNELFVITDAYSCAGNIDFGLENVNRAFDSWTKVPNIREEVSIVSRGICDDSCALFVTANNNLYASGNNDSAMFGNGDRSDVFEYEEVDLELIDTKSWLNLTGNNTIIDIACGGDHTLFLTSNGKVFMCGQNFSTYCLPELISDNEYGNAFIYTPTLMAENIKMIAVGCSYSHTILLTNENKVKLFGQDKKQMNSISKYFNDRNIEIVNIKSGKEHGCFLSVCGKAYTFGNGTYGQIGNGKFDDCITAFSAPYYVNVDEQIIDIECGKDYTMLLSVTNSLYTFGTNRWHQCSAILKDEQIAKPHHFNKIEELNFAYFIEKMVGLITETILFVDPCKYM